MAAFLVGDIVDFRNPTTGSNTRTKISQSAQTGEVVLEGVSDHWLNADAVKMHVTLVYRVRAGDKIEYFSNSQKAWQETDVTAARDTASAGEFQISAKPLTWFTLCSPHIRATSGLLPVPNSPGTPRAKRQDTGTKVMEIAMTPGVSAASELDPSLLLQSQASVGQAAPSSATVTGGGLHVDPWASAAAQLPGHTPGAAASVRPLAQGPPAGPKLCPEIAPQISF